MQFSPRTVKGYRQAMLEFRARCRVMTQTQIAVKAGTTVQAVCDVVKKRRPLNAPLIRWLGYELVYVPIPPKVARSARMSESERTEAQPQPVADPPRPAADPTAAEV